MVAAPGRGGLVYAGLGGLAPGRGGLVYAVCSLSESGLFSWVVPSRQYSLSVCLNNSLKF